MKDNKCPKCGQGEFGPPRYDPEWSAFGYYAHGERLAYSCGVCGYTRYEPTADAPAKEEPK